MAQDSFKLQINNLQALERLLGSDPVLLAEIKDKVADAFLANLVKTHIPCPDLASKELDEKIQKIVDEASKDWFRTIDNNSRWYSRADETIILSEAVRMVIKNAVEDAIKNTIADHIAKDFDNLRVIISNAFDRNKTTLTAYIRDEVRNQISDIVNTELKGVLTHISELNRYLVNELQSKDVVPLRKIDLVL